MFQNIQGFIFASTIDLNMGYLSILLTAKTKESLTIVTQFGFFEWCVLPMGIRPVTDIFQSRMVGIFMSMEANKPNPYLDDIFHGKGSNVDTHLSILNEIFQRLKDAGMQVNLTKSTLCAKELKYMVGKHELLAAYEACASSTILSLAVTYSSDATTRISPALTQSTPISVSYANNSLSIRTMEQNLSTWQANSTLEKMDSAAYRCQTYHQLGLRNLCN
eukprot:CCRYP_003439-RA/>CCRYP_003439-RA protein AED:0.68 eAED:0.68 QI:0/0/0/0.5/0/0/2/0/218